MSFKKFYLTEEGLSEVKTSPKALEDFFETDIAKSMKFGFEAEVITTGFSEAYDDYQESEIIDQEIDSRIDFDEIKAFFNVRESNRSYRRLYNEWSEWFESERQDFYDRYVAERLEGKMQELYDDLDDEDKENYIPEDFEREARQELEDEAEYEFSEADYDLSAFFEDVKRFSTYSEISDEYGFDWPEDMYEQPENTSVSHDSGYSIDRAERIASQLKKELDLDINAYADYHAGKRNTTGWRIEPDASLEPDDWETEAAMEIISPAMPLKEGIDSMMELFAWLKANDAYTSESANTGLHINLSIPDQYEKNIDYVKLVFFSGDDHVLEQFDRVGGYNDRAKEEISRLIGAGHVEEALRKLRAGLMTDVSAALVYSNKTRNVTVNKKQQYVEFRVVGNDYLSMSEVVRQAVLRFARALTIAADPEAYKKEYSKKLAEFLQSQFKDQKDLTTPDVVEIFANSLAQLKYGPPTKEVADKLNQLKVKLKSTLPFRKGERPELPDGKQTRTGNAAFKSECLLNAKALELFLNYRKEVYREENKELYTYLSDLRTGDDNAIKAGFEQFWDVLGEHKNTLVAFTPLSIIQEIRPDFIGRQVGTPFFFKLEPASKKQWISNIIKNYS